MITSLRKFLKWPVKRKSIFIGTLVLLSICQVGLEFFPFPKLYPWLKKNSPPRKKIPASIYSQEDICWAIHRAGYFLFKDTGCLPQAIVGEWLLAQQGIESKLCLGVRRGNDNQIIAHAWLVYDDKILIGDSSGLVPSGFAEFGDFNQSI